MTAAGSATAELLEYRRYVEACNAGVAGKLVPRDVSIEMTPFESGQNPCAKCCGQMAVHTYHPASQHRPFISTQPSVARRLAAGEDVEYTVIREAIEWRCQTCGWVLVTRCAGDDGETLGVGDA
jgi:hypothetical protein